MQHPNRQTVGSKVASEPETAEGSLMNGEGHSCMIYPSGTAEILSWPALISSAVTIHKKK